MISERPVTYDFALGAAAWIVARIEKTGQRRRKILFQCAQDGTTGSGTLGRRLSIELDHKDRLSTVVVDDDGREARTKPIPSGTFADRWVWILATIVPAGDKWLIKTEVGGWASAEVEARLALTGSVEMRYSIGAALDNTDPATFRAALAGCINGTFDEAERQVAVATFEQAVATGGA